MERLLQAYGKDDSITCKVIGSLVAEAEDGIKDAADDSVRDVTLIAAAQQVEHHEMAVYGTLRTWAGILGETDQAEVLESILEEERHADLLLTGIAGYVNTTRRVRRLRQQPAKCSGVEAGFRHPFAPLTHPLRYTFRIP